MSEATTTTPEGGPLVRRDDADNGVTTLTLNRPDKLNALTPALFVELRAHIETIAGDDTVGCVVLTGAGRSFCAGNDLGGISDGVTAPTPHYQAETIDALEALPQPTVGKIRGHCFTGGLELALGCDLLVAAESAQLGDTHGQWGLVAVWGMTVRLPERVGRSRAKELMFTARRIPGPEAAGIGLVDRVVPDDELDRAVEHLTGEIVANSWGTNRIDKALLADHAALDRAAALAHERSLPHGRPADGAERLRAFGARR
ncbi:MAG: enoyl-CoA hydratase/isomerase family protein [Acidimicrobiales bacterium]